MSLLKRLFGRTMPPPIAKQWAELEFCDPANPFFADRLIPRAFKVTGVLDPIVIDTLCPAVADPARLDCIQVRWHSLQSETAGMCVPGDCDIAIGFHGDLHFVDADFVGPRNDGIAWRVVANERGTAGERFVTLAHELGHIYCGHLGPSQARGEWDDTRPVSHSVAEVEAEMVAALIGVHAGLDPGALHGVRERLDLMEVDRTMGRRMSPIAVRYAAQRIACEAGLPPMPPSMFDTVAVIGATPEQDVPWPNNRTETLERLAARLTELLDAEPPDEAETWMQQLAWEAEQRGWVESAHHLRRPAQLFAVDLLSSNPVAVDRLALVRFDLSEPEHIEELSGFEQLIV